MGYKYFFVCLYRDVSRQQKVALNYKYFYALNSIDNQKNKKLVVIKKVCRRLYHAHPVNQGTIATNKNFARVYPVGDCPFVKE